MIDFLFAVLLTHYFWLVFISLQKKYKFGRRISSLLTLLFSIAVIISPLILFSYLLSSEVIGKFSSLQNKWPIIQEKINMLIPNVNKILAFFNQSNINQKIAEFYSSGAAIFLNLVQSIFLNINSLVFHLMIVAFITYYLFIDGPNLLKKVHYLMPLPDKDERSLINEIKKITDATIIGTLLMGLLEGLAAVLIFISFQTVSPFFWAILVLIFSIVPIIGSTVIYISVALLTIVLGNLTKGILILLLGLLSSNIIQNIIKIKILGKKSGLHPALIMLSSIGGIMWLGMIGFIIGPLIASLFIAVWNQFGEYYKKDLLKWNKR